MTPTELAFALGAVVGFGLACLIAGLVVSVAEWRLALREGGES